MGSVNNVNDKIDLSARIFNNFYGVNVAVSDEEYSVVNSFFRSIFENERSADNMTVTFFYISQATGIPVLELLNQVSNQNAIEVTATMAFYLNGLRSPATLLGVNSTVTPNYYTARNVLP